MPQADLQTKLVRKQYLISSDNIKKLEQLAREKGTSAADIVRSAINAYDPNGDIGLTAPDLMELVSKQLKETIRDTRATRRHLNRTLKQLESRGG